jgi:RNA polymerase sigma-70 factor (ECF subfamily)
MPNQETWPVPRTHPDRDVELVCNVAGGNEAALHDLYAAYGQRLYAYALRLTNDPATAEDVVQETLVTVWRTAGRYRGEGRVLAWLLGIVHNLALKAVRRSTTLISEEMEATLTAGAPSPEEQAQAGQESDWVRRGLESLSCEQRAVLELVFYQGLSLEETAQVCGCPLGTVKSRLSYARQHLRQVLSRQNAEEWR